MATNPTVSDRLAKKIADQLRQNSARWMKKWLPEKTTFRLPFNPVTDKAYSAANALMLQAVSAQLGIDDPRWLTLDQAVNLGWSAPGNDAPKAIPIDFWLYENDTPRSRQIANVINASQLAGASVYHAANRTFPVKPETHVADLLADSAANIVLHDKPEVYYSVEQDAIFVPDPDRHEAETKHYAHTITALLEWAEHPTRANVSTPANPTAIDAARRDLRLVLASYFVADAIGSPHDPTPYEKNISLWTEILNLDGKVLSIAAAEASKLADFVVGIQSNPELIAGKKRQLDAMAAATENNPPPQDSDELDFGGMDLYPDSVSSGMEEIPEALAASFSEAALADMPPPLDYEEFAAIPPTPVDSMYSSHGDAERSASSEVPPQPKSMVAEQETSVWPLQKDIEAVVNLGGYYSRALKTYAVKAGTDLTPFESWTSEEAKLIWELEYGRRHAALGGIQLFSSYNDREAVFALGGQLKRKTKTIFDDPVGIVPNSHFIPAAIAPHAKEKFSKWTTDEAREKWMKSRLKSGAGKSASTLYVLYENKAEVKALGAQWKPNDAAANNPPYGVPPGHWYVPSGKDTKPFEKWMTPEAKRAHAEEATAKATSTLYVLYEDKESVKALGAQWKPNDAPANAPPQNVPPGHWFVPQGKDPKPFEKWMSADAKRAHEEEREKKHKMPLLQDVERDFMRYLAENGIELQEDLHIDGEFHYAKYDNKRSKAKYVCNYGHRPSGICKVYSVHTAEGEFAEPYKYTGPYNGKVITLEEIHAQDEQRQLKEQERRIQQEKLLLEKAAEYAATFESLEPMSQQAMPPYHKKKGLTYIDPDIRVRRNKGGDLEQFVAARDIDGKLWSFQRIIYDYKAPGKPLIKLNAEDGRVMDTMHTVGNIKPGGRIYIGEGYATMGSVYMATGDYCVAAFNSGNLASVARQIKQMYPDNPITMVSDNDLFRKTHLVKFHNPGLDSALKIAKELGLPVAIPVMRDANGMPTDMNDLHLREGLDTVRKQLDRAHSVSVEATWEFAEREGSKLVVHHGGMPADKMDDYAKIFRAQGLTDSEQMRKFANEYYAAHYEIAGNDGQGGTGNDGGGEPQVKAPSSEAEAGLRARRFASQATPPDAGRAMDTRSPQGFQDDTDTTRFMRRRPGP